ncbi:septation regulator SpoVG [Salinicoccus halodurans]|uniref:Putative septation protein SpoVG n=1 Tax=Salinicoccus halodurans TaxID=407035 RepID=A0A0F7HM27_9STAP|nr:septation regulator SpoVG [Salinicoccus halodurans]AKG75146.1 hypothetical protein AAT16_13710 [Salinicoccus halodurans]SFK66448.1 stage V sporulation protein G [Salinicoccus halodurans]
MKITDVRLRKVNNQDNRMKALVSITFDDAFVIHDLRVIEGNNGLFVAMPSKRTPDGEFRDIAHPIHSDMRQHVQEEVMRVYEESESEADGSGDSAPDTAESIVDPTKEKVDREEEEHRDEPKEGELEIDEDK